MKKKLLLGALSVGILLPLAGQGPGGPPPVGGPPPQHRMEPPPGGRDDRGGPPRGGGREHTATKAQTLQLVPADARPPARSEVEMDERGTVRRIASNGIPDHRIGKFPNRGNPNEVREQAYDISIPADPEEADEITYLHGPGGRRSFRVFGITLDGVFLEPGTAEFWMGRRDSGWNYEALGGAVPLGLDASYGHVQPDGNYHYHGLPLGLMRRLGHEEGNHSPLIGWAADGFPIYALYGNSDADDGSSEIVELTSSYRLKQGKRPGGGNEPDGNFDGAFVQDYEYVPGLGTLDECNGRYCVTPEFPDGTYAYFMTREWPVVPRAFRGTPEALKEVGGHGGPGGMRGGPPGGRPLRPF